MNLAFSDFETIEALPTIQEKHRAWLKPYEGLNFSIAEDEKHKVKWKTEPKNYKNRNWSPSINLINRLPNRTIIEFDGDDSKAKEYLEVTSKKLKDMGLGFIRSTHKGKSDYLWVEFTRPMTDVEVKKFLYWIAPKGSEVDLNFASSKKVFQVLYAVHWRHSMQRELPIEYFEGKKIDFDALGIKEQTIQTQVKTKNGFSYETAIKEPVEASTFRVYTFKDFENLKKDKNYFVQDYLKPDSVTMVYSPPAEFKTIINYSMGVCIATGKDWMGLKTKKNSVLYLDGENSPQRIKESLMGIYSAMNLRRKNFPFYVVRNGLMIDSKKKVHLGFQLFLEKQIEEKGIKVLIFDTLHRFAYYDENKSDDINLLYNEVFKPLKEKYGLAIVFLHHSNKPDRRGYATFRGSGDFLGMVDVAYRVSGNKRAKTFKIVNEKNRDGEISEIQGKITFDENYICVERQEISQGQGDAKDKTQFLESCDKIMTLFEKESQHSRKDILEFLGAMKFKCSSATIDRVLKWLIKVKKLDKNEKGKYILGVTE